MRLCILAFAWLSGLSAKAAEIDPDYAARIADAIYLAEGGRKAKVPYGILSVRVRDYWHARRICLNTIKLNWTRWHQAGRSTDFIDFLSNRYCPRSVDPRGNANWRRNVKYFLSRSEQAENSAASQTTQLAKN